MVSSQGSVLGSELVAAGLMYRFRIDVVRSKAGGRIMPRPREEARCPVPSAKLPVALLQAWVSTDIGR